MLIESKKRWYRFGVVQGFWLFIDAKVAEGLVCSPLKVYEELVDRTDDELANWAKGRKGMPFFMDPNEAVQKALKNVVDYVNLTYGPTKATVNFLDGADPWMVAYALVHGGTVVTLEIGAVPGKTPKVKLPDVCDQFGIKWDTLFEMVERLGMQI